MIARSVDLRIALAIIAGSAAVMVALMLALRRSAPPGGHFRDSDRASSVFSVMGAGFAIMLGFVVLITFESYANAKRKAEQEANAVFEQYEAAALLTPADWRQRVRGELVCYARSVTGPEWSAMRNGRSSRVTDRWIEKLDVETRDAHLVSMSDNAAYSRWFENASLRDEGRRQRLLEAQSTLPTLLWIMLIIGAVMVVAFVLLYADPEERAVGQAMFSGGVTAIVVVSLLAVSLLASPFRHQNGSIEPTSMRYSLRLIGEEQAMVHERMRPPCDEQGR
jgi:hypothetical protein